MQLLWKAVEWFFKDNVNIESPYDPAVEFLSQTHRMESRNPDGYPYTHIHRQHYSLQLKGGRHPDAQQIDTEAECDVQPQEGKKQAHSTTPRMNLENIMLSEIR